MPHFNLDAEQSVLGAIFLDPSKMVDTVDLLQKTDFYQQRHQLIFDVMIRLYEKDIEIDAVTVTEELLKIKQLENVGGLTYITELAMAVPTAANIVHYATIVNNYSKKRKLVSACQKIIENTYSEDDIGSIMDNAEKEIYNITLSSTSGDFKKMSEILPDVFMRLDDLSGKTDDVTGVDTGYSELNKMTSGFQANDLIIVAARPSVGKTAFALNIGTKVAKKNNRKVAIFSLEMGAEQLVNRIISSEGNIDGQKLTSGQLDIDDWKKFSSAVGELSKLGIYFDDGKKGITVSEIRSKCRKLKQKDGLDLIIIDYLQLIQGSSNSKDRQQEVAEISRTLKGIARELGVPVIALSQLSRGVEQRQDKRPMMSDLRESGSIEQDADIVAFLYRDDYYNKESDSKNTIEIILAKHRNGPTGTIQLGFHKQYNKFLELAPLNIGDPPPQY